MLVLRVRCVDDGRELLVERHGVGEQSVQVAELKALVLEQRGVADEPGDCFLLLRGQILADADVVDLNALGPADFFVFATDATSSSGSQAASVEVFELQKRQLEDMGFPGAAAARALQKTKNNLSDAAALLAEGQEEEAKEETEEEPDLLAEHPSIAPLGSLLNDPKMRRLHTLAATDSFQAMLLLKEHFESRELTQLNENPVATLQLLALPTSRFQAQPSFDAPKQENEVVGIESDSWTAGNGDSDSAVDRVQTNLLPVALGGPLTFLYSAVACSDGLRTRPRAGDVRILWQRRAANSQRTATNIRVLNMLQQLTKDELYR